MMLKKTLPVQKFFLRLERVRDEEAALEAWRQYVLAHGWSRVGNPEVVRHNDPHNSEGTAFVIGRVVKTDEPLLISADIRDGITLPSR